MILMEILYSRHYQTIIEKRLGIRQDDSFLDPNLVVFSYILLYV